MSRLFVAVWPPVEVVEMLRQLPRDDAPGLRWTTPEQWHITLRYLGDVDETAAEEAFDNIDGRSADVSLGPTVERLGPGVVVVPVAGLDGLAESVGAATAAIGEPPHADGFRGHLTLARQKRGGVTSVDGLAVSARFDAGEIALVRSELDADGARYTSVAVKSLFA